MRLFSVSRERRARISEAVALLLLLVVSTEVGYLIFLLIN